MTNTIQHLALKAVAEAGGKGVHTLDFPALGSLAEMRVIRDALHEAGYIFQYELGGRWVITDKGRTRLAELEGGGT
jgi:hypothetical protein